MKNKLFSFLALFISSPFLLMAHGFGNENWEHHMGWGGSMGFMGGGFMMILWIALLAFLVISLGKWFFNRSASPLTEAYQILAQRLAKGEISKEEYLEIKKQLK